MGKIPVALQLYSVREDCKKDFKGTVEKVAKMGYEAVEFAGYYDMSGKDIAKMLKDNNLKCAGTHTGIDTIKPENIEKTIAFNQEFGNKFLVVPWIPDQYRTGKSAYLEVCKLLNQAAEACAKHGMYVGYHNHDFEFKPVDGELPWDIIFSNTKQNVIQQVDCGNCLHGGGDYVGFIKKYPGRAVTVHLKEFSKTVDKPVIGEGDIKWKDFFEACESVGGTQYYIVEIESYKSTPLECVDLSLKSVRKMGR
jgi:sugar phosphate isomerase/epimerase